jgi:hypothetical protein
MQRQPERDDVGDNVEPRSPRRPHQRGGRSTRRSSYPTMHTYGRVTTVAPADPLSSPPSTDATVIRPVDRGSIRRPKDDYYQESSTREERMSPPQRLKEYIKLAKNSPSHQNAKKRSSKTSSQPLSLDTISRLLSIGTSTVTDESTDNKIMNSEPYLQFSPSTQKRILPLGGSLLLIEPEKVSKSPLPVLNSTKMMMLPPRSPNSSKLRSPLTSKSSAAVVDVTTSSSRRIAIRGATISAGGGENTGQIMLSLEHQKLTSPAKSSPSRRKKTSGSTGEGAKRSKQQRRSSLDSLMSILRLPFDSSSTKSPPIPESLGSLSRTRKKEESSGRSAIDNTSTESTTARAILAIAAGSANGPGTSTQSHQQSKISHGSAKGGGATTMLSQSDSVPTKSKSRSSLSKKQRPLATTPPPSTPPSQRKSAPDTQSPHTISSSPANSLLGPEFVGSTSSSADTADKADEEHGSRGTEKKQPTRTSAHSGSKYETLSLTYSQSTSTRGEGFSPGSNRQGESVTRWKRSRTRSRNDHPAVTVGSEIEVTASRSHRTTKQSMSSKLQSDKDERDSLRLSRLAHDATTGGTYHNRTSRATALYNGAMIAMVEKMHGSGGTLGQIESSKVSSHSQRRHRTTMLLTNTTTHHPRHGNESISFDSNPSMPSFAMEEPDNKVDPSFEAETYAIILVPSVPLGKIIEAQKMTGSNTADQPSEISSISSISSISRGRGRTSATAAERKKQKKDKSTKRKDKSRKNDSAIDIFKKGINSGQSTSARSEKRGRSSTSRRTKTNGNEMHVTGGIRHEGRRTSKSEPKDRKALSSGPIEMRKLTVHSMERMQSSAPAAFHHRNRSKRQEFIPEVVKKREESAPSTTMSPPRTSIDVAMAISRLISERKAESDATAVSLPEFPRSTTRGSSRSRRRSPFGDDNSCSRTVRTTNRTILVSNSRPSSFEHPTSPYGYYSPWRKAQRRLSLGGINNGLSTPSPGSSVSSSSVDITELIKKTMTYTDSEVSLDLTTHSRVAENSRRPRDVSASSFSTASTPLHSSKSSFSSSSTSDPARNIQSPNSVTDLQPGEEGGVTEGNSTSTNGTYNLGPIFLEIPTAPITHLDGSYTVVHSARPTSPAGSTSNARHFLRSINLIEDPANDALTPPMAASQLMAASGMASVVLPGQVDSSIPPPPFSPQLPIWMKIQEEKVRQERLKQRLREQRGNRGQTG